MSSTSSSYVQDWDPLELLEIINPDTLSFSCVGHARTRGRRCWNRIAQHNVAAARTMLQGLPQINTNAQLRIQLRDLAGLTLCRAYHQDQVEVIAGRWLRTIVDEVTRRGGSIHDDSTTSSGSGSSNSNAPSSSSMGDMQEELRRLQRQLEELLDRERSRSQQQNRSQPSESSQSTHNASASSNQGPQSGNERSHQGRAPSSSASTPRSRGTTSSSSQSSDAGGAGRPHSADRSSVDSRYDSSRASSPGTDRARQREESRRQEAQGQAERERAEQEAATRQREEERRHEARRQAERERAEREEEARQQAERERARRQREEAAIRMREQQARERAERERHEWDRSWERYERDWANMARMDTTTLDENVKESLPWPVKDGRWQDVNERNIEEFFRHAPDGAFQDRDRFRTLLRQQARRWHEDRIRHRFPRAAGRADVLSLTTIVTQVIVRLMERARLQ